MFESLTFPIMPLSVIFEELFTFSVCIAANINYNTVLLEDKNRGLNFKKVIGYIHSE